MSFALETANRRPGASIEVSANRGAAMSTVRAASRGSGAIAQTGEG